MACQTDTKSTPTVINPVPVAPKPGSVATPSDLSRPNKMINNFQRMQGEWQRADNPNQELQVRGKAFLEIEIGKDRSESANQFKVVKSCEGIIDLNGSFFIVGNRCFKLLSISIEEMEVENLEQQKVIKYIRI